MVAPVPVPEIPLDEPEYEGRLERELGAVREDDDMDVLVQVQDEIMIDPSLDPLGCQGCS